MFEDFNFNNNKITILWQFNEITIFEITMKLQL